MILLFQEISESRGSRQAQKTMSALDHSFGPQKEQ